MKTFSFVKIFAWFWFAKCGKSFYIFFSCSKLASSCWLDTRVDFMQMHQWSIVTLLFYMLINSRMEILELSTTLMAPTFTKVGSCTHDLHGKYFLIFLVIMSEKINFISTCSKKCHSIQYIRNCYLRILYLTKSLLHLKYTDCRDEIGFSRSIFYLYWL